MHINATIITDLMPFREYKFSIVVVNLDGRSEIVNISATTLSLGIYSIATTTDTHVHLHVANIVTLPRTRLKGDPVAANTSISIAIGGDPVNPVSHERDTSLSPILDTTLVG